MSILIYADMLDAARELKSAATALSSSECVKAFFPTEALSNEAAAYMDSYYAGSLPVQDAHAVASAIAQVAEQFECDKVLLRSDRIGKDLAGHLAQIMKTDALTGVFELTSDGVASRSALGGALIEESVLTGGTKIFAVSPKSYSLCGEGAGNSSEIRVDIPAPAVTVKAVEPRKGGHDDVAAADVVIAVGCGFDEQGDMTAVEELAGKLKGAVGCTKPIATDRKWFPEDCIIGISGKTCRPSLAISIGISGQVQYWAGIRDAGTAIAINSDKNAAIVSLCDASVIMDGPKAVAELNAKLG